MNAVEKSKNNLPVLAEPWPRRLTWPKGLTPSPYQIDDALYALSRRRTYLALDPGLGKSIIAALIARALTSELVVVVCPPFLIETIYLEFEKWGALKGVLFFADTRIHKPDVQTFLARRAPRATLIIDEAHRFKTESARRTKKLIAELAPLFKRVVLLSGTPIENRPMELWPVLSNLAPELFPMTKFKYGVRYCGGYHDGFGWDFSGASNTQEWATKIKASFMRRRLKAEVLTDLPPKTEELVFVGDNLPPRLAAIDRALLKEFSPEDLLAGIAPNGHTSTYRKELGKLKVPHGIAFARDILTNTNESLLIFAIHIEVVAALEKGLAEFKPLVISGRVPTHKRNGIAREFQLGKASRVMIGNIDACGVGFTLTKATRVLFVERSWVPTKNSQASDRAHRRGQRDNVLVQSLVFKNSIDRKVIETELSKASIIKML